MRLGFISDIHGNFHALELVLSHLKRLHVDQIICLGDVASLGPQPREVIDCLRQLDIPMLLGNHDHYLLNPHLFENHHPWLKAAEQWCLDQLDEADLNFLSSFKKDLIIEPTPSHSIHCFHGSPRSNEEWLYPDRATSLLDEVFEGLAASIVVVGHTHVQLLRPHRDKLLLNPGSVGLPFLYPKAGPDQHPFRRADFATLDVNANGVNVQFHQVPIDFDHLATVARANAFPDVEAWLSSWIA